MNSEFNEVSNLFKWNKTIDLPQQLQWRHADEQVLKEWKIKARPYNTKIANGMFAFLFLINSMLAYLTIDLSTPITLFMSAGLFFFLNFVLASVTHQKTKFAYRMTKENIELCEWKEFPKAALILLKWVTIFATIILFSIALAEPKALFAAIVGPGGLGLIYLSMAHSEKFQKMHTSYHTACYDWSEFKKIYIDRSRHIIGLEHLWFSPYLEKEIPWALYVFCEKRDFEDTLEIIKCRTGNAPCSEEKIDVIQTS